MGVLQKEQPEDTPDEVIHKYLGSEAASEFKGVFPTVRQARLFVRRWLSLKNMKYGELVSNQRGRYKMYKQPEETPQEIAAREWVAGEIKKGLIVYWCRDDQKNIIERSSITREQYESDYKHRHRGRYVFMGVDINQKDRWGNE